MRRQLVFHYSIPAEIVVGEISNLSNYLFCERNVCMSKNMYSFRNKKSVLYKIIL